MMSNPVLREIVKLTTFESFSELQMTHFEYAYNQACRYTDNIDAEKALGQVVYNAVKRSKLFAINKTGRLVEITDLYTRLYWDIRRCIQCYEPDWNATEEQ